MNPWNTAFQRGLAGGATSSVLSTAALAALGKEEGASAYAPTNAISHWIWGGQAMGRDEPSLRPGFETQLSKPSLAPGAVLCRRA